jgi:SepF-like predicted cell division protein (DUF552 family)
MGFKKWLRNVVSKKKDIDQFQTAIQKLKRMCSQFNFDFVGLEEGYLVVTPPFAKIER